LKKNQNEWGCKESERSYLGIKCDDGDEEEKVLVMMLGSSALFKNGDGDDTIKDREKASRYEIQLITTDAKGELHWVPNSNNSHRERENERS
jgi:hypothetical protein